MITSLVTLDALCSKIGSGATPRGGNESYKSNGISLVRSMNVRLAHFERKDLAYIDGDQAKKLNNVALESGDVLLNITGASVARCCIVEDTVLPGRVNQHVCILRPDAYRLDPRYLMRFLTSAETQESLLRIAGAGATREAITKSEIQKFRIPIPPMPEQKRIAGILDASDGLRAKRRAALAQLDTLLQSTFLDLFGDPVTNPKCWKVVPLSTATLKIQTGPFGSLLHKEEYVEGGVPLINPMHIVAGAIKADPRFSITEEKCQKLKSFVLKSNDVIMARRGEMGRCAIVGKEHNGMLCGTGSIFLRLNPQKLTQLYLVAVLSSAPMKRKLESFSQGVTMANLNKTIVGNLGIPLPPLDLQRRFASIVESVERQKARHREHLAQLDTLFASLQQRAFKGEL